MGKQAMSDQAWLDRIGNEAGNKRVLLVEGEEDRGALAHFLDHYPPAEGWRSLLLIFPAGRKDHVRIGVEEHPDWAGVVDRDEWSEQDLRQLIASSSRLSALPRFCIESFFCVPAEIWTAIPAVQRVRMHDDPVGQAGQCSPASLGISRGHLARAAQPVPSDPFPGWIRGQSS